MSDLCLVPRRDVLAWRVIDGEAVLIELSTAIGHYLNRTATGLWRLIERGATRSQLAHALRRAFGLAEPDAVADVERFVRFFEERGLLDFAPPTGDALDGLPWPLLEPYVCPGIESEGAFYASAGCGKSTPHTFSCIRVNRAS